MNRFLKLLVSACFLCFPGCGGGAGNSQSLAFIESVSPEEDSQDATQLTSVTASFAVDVDPASINGGTFYVEEEDASFVQGDVSYDPLEKTARFSPFRSLKKNSVYRATLRGEIRDAQGKPFLQSFSWKFKTSGFLFIVLSDTHVRIRGNPDQEAYDGPRNVANLRQTVALINDRYPTADFVIVTGDLVGCLFSSDPAEYGTGRDTPADRFKAVMDNLVMPYHVALGNHDYQIGFDAEAGEGITAPDWSIGDVEAVWQKLFNHPSYYAFDDEGVRFYILNSATGRLRRTPCPGCVREKMCLGSFSPEQTDWLSKDIEEGRPSFLFFHHPVYTDDTRAGDWALPGDEYMVHPSDPIYDILNAHSPDILGIFVGHGHFSMKGRIGRATEVFETPSTGDFFGAPAHMNVVNVLAGGGEIKVLTFDQ